MHLSRLALSLVLLSPTALATTPSWPDPKPYTQPLEGCLSDPVPQCIESSAGGMVCQCRAQPKDDTEDATLFVIRNIDGPSCQFNDEALFTLDLNFFHILEADLDQSGKAEKILLNMSMVSNGMGVQWWNMRVFPEGDLCAKPLRWVNFDANVDLLNTQTQPPSLLISFWGEGKDAKGKDGTYFYGQEFRYSQGQLYPLDSLKRRRYLNTFAEERNQEAMMWPRKWLSSPAAEMLTADPRYNGVKPSRLERGRIGKVKPLSLEGVREPAYSIEWTGNKSKKTLPLDYNNPNAESSFYLGIRNRDGRYQRYPEAYLPLDWSALEGHEAELARYGDEYGEQVLWILPKQ